MSCPSFKDKKAINKNDLILLYDTHGMQPEIVKNIAKDEGVNIEIPKNFESMVAEIHSHETEEEKYVKDKTDLPLSDKLYYKDHYIKDFNAKVLWVNKSKKGLN